MCEVKSKPDARNDEDVKAAELLARVEGERLGTDGRVLQVRESGTGPCCA